MLEELNKPKISQVNIEEFNSLLKTMIDNDVGILPNAEVSPKIWYCKWYGVPSSKSGYKQMLYKSGDAVWINTENEDDFVEANKNRIKTVILNNSYLKNKYEESKDDNVKLYQLYKDVAFGNITGDERGLPLYYIGDITKNVQIRISLSNDNDQLPTNDAYWADFFINNDETHFSNIILDRTKELCYKYLDNHLNNYHLSGIYEYWNDKYNESKDLSDFFLLQDLSNLKGTFDFNDTPGNNQQGFDYVLYFHQYKFSDKCYKWFRVWNSGVLEHGGIIDSQNPTITKDSLVYTSDDVNYTHLKVNLNWSDGQITAPGYTYKIASEGFYFEDQKIDIGDHNSISLQDTDKFINQENHYTVIVTPITDKPYENMNGKVSHGIYYMTNDVNSLTNKSFCIMLDNNARYYSYYVSGYSINSQQDYK